MLKDHSGFIFTGEGQDEEIEALPKDCISVNFLKPVP